MSIGPQMRAFFLARGLTIFWKWGTMEPKLRSDESRNFFRGAAGLIVAVAVVLVLLIGLPNYRWFFLISVGIGLVVAAALYLWHRFKPLKEDDVEHKRPLGLE
jgi:fatty acid desaturase